MLAVKHAPTLVAGALAFAFAPWPAYAQEPGSDEKAACLEAHERGQLLRNTAHLREAQSALSACARPACPALVEKDCASLLGDLEREQPTLIVEARDSRGDETLQGRVRVDGALVKERLDGVAIPVDPGEHVLRIERDDGPALEQRVVARPFEKDRRIVFEVPSSSPPPPPPPPAHVVPLAAYALGGVAVLAAGFFAYFAVTGKQLENQRMQDCAPRCSDAQVSPIRVDFAVADVSLGVTVLAAAGGLWLALAHAPGGSSLAVRVDPARGGGSLGAELSF